MVIGDAGVLPAVVESATVIGKVGVLPVAVNLLGALGGDRFNSHSMNCLLVSPGITGSGLVTARGVEVSMEVLEVMIE